jgi:Na+/proline symporter
MHVAVQAVEEGPRAADQFAAVTSCVIVMTSAVAKMQQLMAQAVCALAKALQHARETQDSIAASNIVRIFCFLYASNGIGVFFCVFFLCMPCLSTSGAGASRSAGR